MAGIISLLGGRDADNVERLMAAMASEFGVPRGFPGGEPHVSYHLGDYRPEPPATTRMADVAASVKPFDVQISGYGVFGGHSPVLYLAVARGPELSSLHAAIVAAFASLGFANNPYYEPANWLPHITIAQQNLDREAFPQIASWLGRQHLRFTARLSSIAFARETATSLEVDASFALGPG